MPFNKTNKMVDWARWTWNPVTGCKIGCKYCYAHDIANRFYEEKFEPTFRPERLSDPKKQPIPKTSSVKEHTVFVVSMGELFGKWVPQEWIDAVIEACANSPKWNFVFLTKNPKRMVEINWPDNCWVGTTVDCQYRVDIAEHYFKLIKARVKCLSCEPFQEKLTFNHLEYFDWVKIGARSRNSALPGFQPKREWVDNLIGQAREANCAVFTKPNLKVGPVFKEYPI